MRDYVVGRRQASRRRQRLRVQKKVPSPPDHLIMQLAPPVSLHHWSLIVLIYTHNHHSLCAPVAALHPLISPHHSSSLNTILIKPISQAGSQNYCGLPDLSGFGQNLLSSEFHTRLFCRGKDFSWRLLVFNEGIVGVGSPADFPWKSETGGLLVCCNRPLLDWGGREKQWHVDGVRDNFCALKIVVVFWDDIEFSNAPRCWIYFWWYY